MTKILNLLISLTILTSSCAGQKKEEKLVKQTFDNYKSAILTDKGEEASKYIDSRTIKYYNEILEQVKDGDSTKINSLSLIDKLTIFTIRHRSTKEEILSFDGKGLFIYAIKNGMIGKNSVSNASIENVTVDNEFVKGQFISNGQETPLYLHFYKESGQWKLDLTSIFSASNVAFKKMVDDSGQEENEYLFSLLEMITSNKPDQKIWQTIK